MKAIICRNDGSPEVVKYEDVEKPAAGDNQVLIKVRAASVNLSGVADTLRYHHEGHARGKVVITLDEANKT